MASGGPAPLARMYREQLCRRARSVGTAGLLPELNGCSFETEEYLLEAALREVRQPEEGCSAGGEADAQQREPPYEAVAHPVPREAGVDHQHTVQAGVQLRPPRLQLLRASAVGPEGMKAAMKR